MRFFLVLSVWAWTGCQRQTAPAPEAVTNAVADIRAPIDNTSSHPIGRLFEPSQPGDAVRLRLVDDSPVEGVLAGIYADHIELQADQGVRTVARTNLSAASRAQFYVEEFILMESRQLEDIDTPSATLTVREMRFAAEDDIVARAGPGPHYRRIEGFSPLKGMRLQVVEERGPWIRVVATDGGQTRGGWVYRFLTTPLDPMDAGRQERELAVMKEAGWLDRVDPVASEAFVHRRAWHESDPLLRQGVARALALFCKQAGPKHLSRVDVLESESGKRLAKYSESLGYKTF